VEFLDLSGCPTLFHDLFDLFGEDHVTLGRPAEGFSTLGVQEAGAYTASFVPSLDEFHRLDAQFRIDPAVFDGLRAYQSWGFAVFQLQANSGREIHPIALRFPSQLKNKLFLPAVHVFDGEFHNHAHFDHYCYIQRLSELATAWGKTEASTAGFGWAVKPSTIALPEELQPRTGTPDVEFDPEQGVEVMRRYYNAELARGSLPEYLTLASTAGLVDPTMPIHRLTLQGEFRNTDVILKAT